MIDVQLIAINGRKRHGKDSFAKALLEAGLGETNRWATRAFADPMKEAASKLFHVPLGAFYDERLKDTPLPGLNKTPRELLLFLHDVLKPDFGSGFFTRHMDFFWKQCREHGTPLIITDCRLPKEANWVHERGGVVVEVTDPRKPEPEGEVPDSEKPLPNDLISYRVLNKGTLEDLLDQAKFFLDWLQN